MVTSTLDGSPLAAVGVMVAHGPAEFGGGGIRCP